MKTNQIQSDVEMLTTDTTLESPVSVKAYYEMDILPVQEMTDLEQLQKQLEQLQVLQSRARFMVREIAYLLKAE